MWECKSKIRRKGSRFQPGSISDKKHQNSRGCNGRASKRAHCVLKVILRVKEPANIEAKETRLHEQGKKLLVDSRASEHVVNDVRLLED